MLLASATKAEQTKGSTLSRLAAMTSDGLKVVELEPAAKAVVSARTWKPPDELVAADVHATGAQAGPGDRRVRRLHVRGRGLIATALGVTTQPQQLRRRRLRALPGSVAAARLKRGAPLGAALRPAHLSPGTTAARRK